jgi:RNA polymerase sigma-70 factor (ECF subfamily)
VVLAAGQQESPQAAAALENLCRTYWYPLYVYVRQRGYRPEDAEDLTQEFFARFLARKFVAAADPNRGKFRWFLLTSLQHFLANEWERARAAKRGGAQPVRSWHEPDAEQRYQREPVDNHTPEKAFDRRWAVLLLERVMGQLRQGAQADGTGRRFEELAAFLWGDKGSPTYAATGERLGMSEGAVKVAVHRLRHRYEERLRAAIAETVATPEQIEEEIRDLFAAFD